jgi:dTDP-glucose pyrophosphorylase
LIVGDKAIIEYVINAMKSTGINDITIIVGWRKHAILDYLGSGERLGVKLTYVVQDNRDGLAKAVLAGEHLSDDEPFLVVLGDNFFYPPTFLEDILAFHKKKKAEATIGVAEVQDPTRHGMIKPGAHDNILDIVEKPKPQDAPSTFGCIGIYLFTSAIFEAIRKTKPGFNGEYQLTDAIKIMIDEGHQVFYRKINGKHIDIGTMDDLREANKFLSSL